MLNVVAHNYNPSPWEVEVEGDSQVTGMHGLRSKTLLPPNKSKQEKNVNQQTKQQPPQIGLY